MVSLTVVSPCCVFVDYLNIPTEKGKSKVTCDVMLFMRQLLIFTTEAFRYGTHCQEMTQTCHPRVYPRLE